MKPASRDLFRLDGKFAVGMKELIAGIDAKIGRIDILVSNTDLSPQLPLDDINQGWVML